MTRRAEISAMLVLVATCGAVYGCARALDGNSAGMPDASRPEDADADSGAIDEGPLACPDAAGVRDASALPSGACEGRGGCAFLVWHACPCPTEHSPIDGYRCECSGGQWTCALSGRGASACTLDAECRDRWHDAATD